MKTFKWTVEFEVDETWVADGFDLSRGDQAQDMIANRLPYAYGHEITGRVVSAPDAEGVAKAQGYASAADMRAKNPFDYPGTPEYENALKAIGDRYLPTPNPKG